MSFICFRQFKLQQSTHYKFYIQAILFFNKLLEGPGSEEIQKVFYSFFITEINSENLFHNELKLQHDLYANLTYIYNNFLNLAYKNRQKIQDKEKIFRFIQLLCENHNTDLQNYVRVQKNSKKNVDLIKIILQYLKNLLFFRSFSQ